MRAGQSLQAAAVDPASREALGGPLRLATVRRRARTIGLSETVLVTALESLLARQPRLTAPKLIKVMPNAILNIASCTWCSTRPARHHHAVVAIMMLLVGPGSLVRYYL